ncbi:MAG TPA: hypothetical protein VGZ90_16585 [Puia sp.]|jgi:hypothetical protein|nr:hypothetical protein [Puia sp.]
MAQQKNNKLLTIVWLSFLTGSLDGILSFILSYPASPELSYRYIASGLFGMAAFTANYMVLWGILFHYLIASAFSAAFFILYPNFKRIINNKYILAFVFGLIIWIISTFGILPLSNVPDIKGVAKYPSQLNLIAAIISIAGLILCLGLPISLIANKYYRKNAGTTGQDFKLSI